MTDDEIRAMQDQVHQLARRRIRTWMNQERPYADAKWPDEHAVLMGDTAIKWDEWVEQYVHRAMTLGLDTQRGRVALAKGIMTATRVLEQAIVEYGGLPQGGVPS